MKNKRRTIPALIAQGEIKQLRVFSISIEPHIGEKLRAPSLSLGHSSQVLLKNVRSLLLSM